MAHLPTQFKKALENIEPKSDKVNAPKAHMQVRAALEADDVLASYGIDPILIGSYKRDVSIRRIKDVDVFARMTSMPDDVTAHQILTRFCNLLTAEFGNDSEGNPRVERQDRSLKVRFPDYDLHVDAVPARPRDDGTWEIPRRGYDNEWVQTNPDKLSTLATEMNAAHSGLYKPVVKLMRQTRRALRGNAKPGGLFIELATYTAFDTGRVAGNDVAEYYTSTLRAVSDIIDDIVSNGADLADPTLTNAVVKFRATDQQMDLLNQAFKNAATTAEDALAEPDEGKAAKAWRALLGCNGDDEIVFPMPEGFDENGKRRSFSIIAGANQVPAGKRDFG
jgi:hypothetical protein